jgi:uncharacterized protein YkwD
VKNILILILISTFAFGLKTDKKVLIEEDSIDLKYLEYLVKHKVDSIRTSNKAKALLNDSILYIAAKHHSEYMLKNSILTHSERKREFRTSMSRVEYYKASYMRVGENVLNGYYLDVVIYEGVEYPAYTYNQLAFMVVDVWINSPGHFKNIKSKNFTHTAVAISADLNKKKIYVCQVFAGDIEENYKAQSSKEFFPYE